MVNILSVSVVPPCHMVAQGLYFRSHQVQVFWSGYMILNECVCEHMTSYDCVLGHACVYVCLLESRKGQSLGGGARNRSVRCLGVYRAM